MKLLMIVGDRDLINGRQGPFYYLLKEFSNYWERIYVICPADSPKTKPDTFFENVILYGCPVNIKSIYELAREIYQQDKYDLITAHDYPPFRHGQAARKLNQDYGVNYITEIHHIVGYPKAANLREFLLKIYFDIFFKTVASDAKAIRVVNQHQVPEYLQKIGIPNDKIKYWPSFYLDQQVFRPQNQQKKYDILFVGRLAENKGLGMLIEILKMLAADNPEIKLAIVGTGVEELKLKRKVSQLNLKNNIEFLGWQPDSRALANIYQQAKILLITSANEGGPRVGLEALACGLAVVSTPVGIMTDLIKDGENGFLVNWSAADFAKQIKFILNNELNFDPQKISLSVKEFDYQTSISNYAQGLINQIT